jgi:transposase-like protein
VTLPAEDRERLLAALRRVDPAGFRAEVRAVLTAHEEVAAAARALGVAEATLRRWLAADPTLAGA